MKTLAARRTRQIIVCVLLAAVAVAVAALGTTALRDMARLSGWTLLGLVVFLAAYNLRKKLPFLPLGSSAAWLQAHIYLGLLSAVLFGIHVGWRIPNGVFEGLLGGLYGLVFLSGLAGLFLSRSLPPRLTTRGDEVLFERIAARRRQLQVEVEQAVLACQAASESTAVAQFYAERLQPFFAASRNFWQHLLQSNRPRHALLSEIRSHERYLSDVERQSLQEIAQRVQAKDDLDYQYALQATLKYWLFVHVPLTYALLVFAAFHLLLVYAFAGGAS